MSERINENMTSRQARLACARELNELQEFTAVDYEQLERRYGRSDGRYVDQTLSGRSPRTIPPSDSVESDVLGEFCAVCPVWKIAGDCALRDSFQQLATEQRATYELATGGGPGNLNPDHLGGIDGWYDSGWRYQ
jgi:hypothetical protein